MKVYLYCEKHQEEMKIYKDRDGQSFACCLSCEIEAEEEELKKNER